MSERIRQCLFAGALFQPNASLEKRLEILGRHLSVKPGKTIEIDRSYLRDVAPINKKPEKIYGTIQISPPKGSCFIITTHEERSDLEICKPTWVKWLLEDIDRNTGRISWTIKTGPDDFGTPVSWQTPYTIAKVIPLSGEFHKSNSSPVFFKTCVATQARDDGTPRKITLTTFDNKKWLIRFPDKDVPLPAVMTEEEAYAIEQKALAEEAAKKKEAEGGHGGGHGGEHEEKKEPPPEEAPKAPPVNPDEPPRKVAEKDAAEAWTINTRRGFEMNVGNFISDGSMPPGKKGTCRYSYDFIPGDFSRGRVECHNADQFLYMYVVLPCMETIIPSTFKR